MDKIDKEKCFVFYQRWYEQMKRLPDKEKLLIYESICEYAFNHIITDLAYYLECVMDNIRKTIDDNEEKQNKFLEKQRLNGLRGGRPRLYRNPQEPKKPTGYLENPTKPNETQKSHNKNKEQEQEQRIKTKNKNKEQEKNNNNCIIKDYVSDETSDAASETEEKKALRSEEKGKKVFAKRIISFFNEQIKANNSAIKPVIVTTDKRISQINARAIQYDNAEEMMKTAIVKATQSQFLNGANNRNWIATFDWIFRPNNFPKILEGNYDNGNHNQQQANNGSIYDGGRAARRQEFINHVRERFAQPNTETEDIPEALRDL